MGTEIKDIDGFLAARGFSPHHTSPNVSRDYVNENNVHCEVNLTDITFEFVYVTTKMNKFSSGKYSSMVGTPGHFDRAFNRFMGECCLLMGVN